MTSKAIDSHFSNSASPTVTRTENEAAQLQLATVGDIGLVARSIIGAVFATLIFLTGNAISQSIRERHSEIGMLRAIGFGRKRILCLLVSESVLVCIAAAAAGILGASMAFDIVSNILPNVSAYIGAAPFPWRVLGFGLAVALVLGLAASIIPAFVAARIPITAAMNRL